MKRDTRDGLGRQGRNGGDKLVRAAASVSVRLAAGDGADEMVDSFDIAFQQVGQRRASAQGGMRRAQPHAHVRDRSVEQLAEERDGTHEPRQALLQASR